MGDTSHLNEELWQTMTLFRVRVLSRMQSDLAQLQQVDLSLPKWLVILGLVEQGPATISELRVRLGRSQAATSQLVDSLEQRGLVERRADVFDGRRSVVHPTRTAKTLVRKLEKSRREGFERIMGELPAAMLQQLNVALTAVLNAMGSE